MSNLIKYFGKNSTFYLNTDTLDVIKVITHHDESETKLNISFYDFLKSSPTIKFTGLSLLELLNRPKNHLNSAYILKNNLVKNHINKDNLIIEDEYIVMRDYIIINDIFFPYSLIFNSNFLDLIKSI